MSSDCLKDWHYFCRSRDFNRFHLYFSFSHFLLLLLGQLFLSHYKPVEAFLTNDFAGRPHGFLRLISWPLLSHFLSHFFSHFLGNGVGWLWRIPFFSCQSVSWIAL